jgi:hypothetical protein
MKKRATPKKTAKKKVAASVAQKPADTKAAAPAARPQPATAGREAPEQRGDAGRYTPAPLQSSGWPPFRYPPQ